LGESIGLQSGFHSPSVQLETSSGDGQVTLAAGHKSPGNALIYLSTPRQAPGLGPSLTAQQTFYHINPPDQQPHLTLDLVKQESFAVSPGPDPNPTLGFFSHPHHHHDEGEKLQEAFTTSTYTSGGRRQHSYSDHHAGGPPTHQPISTAMRLDLKGLANAMAHLGSDLALRIAVAEGSLPSTSGPTTATPTHPPTPSSSSEYPGWPQVEEMAEYPPQHSGYSCQQPRLTTPPPHTAYESISTQLSERLPSLKLITIDSSGQQKSSGAFTNTSSSFQHIRPPPVPRRTSSGRIVTKMDYGHPNRWSASTGRTGRASHMDISSTGVSRNTTMLSSQLQPRSSLDPQDLFQGRKRANY